MSKPTNTANTGLSTYDHYEDDAGVCFTSYLRPIVNMRPKYRMSSMNITVAISCRSFNRGLDRPHGLRLRFHHR